MATTKQLVICLSNEGYETSLERRKLYERLVDSDAGKRGLMRVIDESGDDYLYRSDMFAEIDLPLSLRQAVLAAA